MRTIKITKIGYTIYNKIRNAIMEIIPFALINSDYSEDIHTATFTFWDTAYIPGVLMPFAIFPPETHENVKKLHKEITDTVGELKL